MSAGSGQEIVGVALATSIVTDPVAPLKSAASVGVKLTERVWSLPACNTVPAAGVYVSMPGTDAVASSCVTERAVPKTIPAGLDQVIVGVALVTVKLPVALAAA